MNKEAIESAVNRLRNAASSKVPCDPIRDLIDSQDVTAAYAIQDLITEQRVKSGEKVVGAKIGLTSVAVQSQLGVDQPDYGVLFESMHVPNNGVIPWSETMQPKVETEIAFTMARSLRDDEYTPEAIVNAIASAAVSVEIVGSRIEGWNIRIADTIADNASSSHFVISENQVDLRDIDLVNCHMSMTKNGSVVSEGKGEACLGSPINAALWLATTMRDLGRPLSEGDIVLAGALGPMVNAAPGDEFEGTVEGFGSVKVKFSKQ